MSPSLNLNTGLLLFTPAVCLLTPPTEKVATAFGVSPVAKRSCAESTYTQRMARECLASAELLLMLNSTTQYR